MASAGPPYPHTRADVPVIRGTQAAVQSLEDTWAAIPVPGGRGQALLGPAPGLLCFTDTTNASGWA
jgi:hypothetical protein